MLFTEHNYISIDALLAHDWHFNFSYHLSYIKSERAIHHIEHIRDKEKHRPRFK